MQRSFSNYDMSPTNGGSPKYDRGSKGTNSPGGGVRPQPPGNRLGASEFSAALPDFVQDHLVLESWYLNSSPKSTSPVSVDFENLPDFTINDSTRNNYDDFNRVPARNPSPLVPLDLPVPLARREQAPPDLPPDVTEGQRGAFGYGGAEHRDSANDKMQTLPDFLSDGPIHSSNRLADVTQDTPHFNSPDENPLNAAISRLHGENERLRNELDDSRAVIINQTCRISELEHLLQQRTMTGEAAGSRAVANDALVCTLRQQVQKLQTELDHLRRENESLKEEGGAVGGASSRRNNPSSRTSRTQLSRDLRHAANSAENNLR